MVNLNASSGFALQIKVPSGAALGTAQLQVTVNDAGIGGAASLAFEIQEFRRPEFEVVTRTESAGPYVLTKPLTVAAVGQYFSGGVLPNAPVVVAGDHRARRRTHHRIGRSSPSASPARTGWTTAVSAGSEVGVAMRLPSCR